MVNEQPDKQPEEKKQHGNSLYALTYITQVGVGMCSCVLLGVLLGKFLDNVFSTAPKLLLICSLLGVAATFKLIFDLAGKKKK